MLTFIGVVLCLMVLVCFITIGLWIDKGCEGLATIMFLVTLACILAMIFCWIKVGSS